MHEAGWKPVLSHGAVMSLTARFKPAAMSAAELDTACAAIGSSDAADGVLLTQNSFA